MLGDSQVAQTLVVAAAAMLAAAATSRSRLSGLPRPLRPRGDRLGHASRQQMVSYLAKSAFGCPPNRTVSDRHARTDIQAVPG